jgi:hypothetical protein
VHVVVYNGPALIAGTVTANSNSGQGGAVALSANEVAFTGAIVQANGATGGAVFATATSGNLTLLNTSVAANATASTGGTVQLAGQNQTQLSAAQVTANGVTNGGGVQIGINNTTGSGSTLAPPAQAAFDSGRYISTVTTLDSQTLVTANVSALTYTSGTTPVTVVDPVGAAGASNGASTGTTSGAPIGSGSITESLSSSVSTFTSQAGQIYIAGDASLVTAARLTANAGQGGLIVMSSPSGMFQNTGYVQTNGGAGLGGTIAQSGLVSTVLTGARLEANGLSGGGNIVVGRDFKMNPLSKVVALADAFADLTLLNANNPVPKSCDQALAFLEITLGQPFNKAAFNGLKLILNHKPKSAKGKAS